MSLFLGFLSCSIDTCFYSSCQYHPLLVTIALYYSLKSWSLILPVLLFFLMIAFSIQGALCLHTNFKTFVSFLWKMPLVIWKGLHWVCRLPWVVYSLSVDSSNPSTRCTFPFVLSFSTFISVLEFFLSRGYLPPQVGLCLDFFFFLMWWQIGLFP